MIPQGGSQGGYGMDRPSSPSNGERGYRRRKLAAMAGNLYRTGQAAVTEIRESYAQTRATRGFEGGGDNHGRIHIPGAFPDVAIVVQGTEQMVLFPSYAKRHSRRDWGQTAMHQSQAVHGSLRDEDYWRQEWERNEDERAIVDVDVRGWIYSPHTGPMTRRNRMLIGLARQLSGIPAPRADQAYGAPTAAPLRTHHQMHEEQREQERIAHEAARIERQGQAEKKAAYQGRYSEKPQDEDGRDDASVYAYRTQTSGQTVDSPPGSPAMPARTFSSSTAEMSDAELALANANLMARIAPFMTNPLVALPITLFFYNDTSSQSKTVITNDAGHFVMRAALDFVPTHVRVLANEDLSATQEITLIEPYGVSVISDIDDTVKKSNISMGAKEIFRNTFVRDLSDLTIDGVKEWYGRMHELGVSFHYCSNSPWQLFPVLASFFKLVGLPPGSLHLKQYSGMLQGIFEPVAERKKSTLNRLLRDFPQRKFILVGDSGEADLEVYTELALANPGRILAVFIRDVTTPEQTQFFDSGFDLRRKVSNLTLNESAKPLIGGNAMRQNSTPAAIPRKPSSTGPAMGMLIDFSEEPEETKVDHTAALAQLRQSSASNRSASTSDLSAIAARKPPPPKPPAKPKALRSARSITELNKGVAGLGISAEADVPPPMPPRKTPAHPLSQMSNSSEQSVRSQNTTPKNNNAGERPPPPPPRRRGTPSNNSTLTPDARPPLPPRTTTSTSASTALDIDPPPAFTQTRSSSRSNTVSPSASPGLGPQGVNKKLELWRRRLARAHEQLDGMGVALYTWRRGGDVVAEAEGIITRALRDMERERRRARSEA